MPLSLTPLGDVRAEADHRMLDQSFLETPDYQTLLATNASKIVVGRRGTGKSALVYSLAKHWGRDKNIILITISPEEDQVIGIRPLLSFFGNQFTLVRAGVKLIWRYAIVLEVLDRLAGRYKVGQIVNASELLTLHLRRWRSAGPEVFSRIRNVLRTILVAGLGAEEIIGDLAHRLQLRELLNEAGKLIEEATLQCIILVDRLDEGYQYDTPGIAFVDGIIYGLAEVDATFPKIRALVFLRDNIFRSIAALDPDFSRNIEGQALRLHWDTYQLFNMVCNRLRTAFSINTENNQRVWDRCTANDLQHQEGFKRCLQLTLYRPRDIIILLNQAFYNAGRQQRSQLVQTDIETSAKHISANRLGDLHKEYELIFPGLSYLTAAFVGRNPELTVAEATALLEVVAHTENLSLGAQQDFAVFRTPNDQLRNLYSVGFLGIHDEDTNSFTFCHDGKHPDREFELGDRILVHPCYWLALNLMRDTLDPNEAEEINDEYDIQITSQTPQIRSHKIGQIIASLDQIPLGADGATQFENWCQLAIRIAFVGKLQNVALHPNRNAIQRRDVVATNLSTGGAWKRIREDYKTRQVIFEVKNYQGIGLDEYRQLRSYLCDDYGTMGFLITRDNNHTLAKGVELEHFLEMYHKHHVTIVKLTGRLFCTMLSKLRNPQKHDAPDILLNKLLDTYSRQYLSGVTDQKKQR